MPILHAQNLTIGYRQPRRDDVVVAKELAVVLHPGELICLLGPNGAGKSTLMRTLAGMQPPLGGAVCIGDGKISGESAVDIHDLPPRELARRLSIVLTERVDAGNLSAYDLVALGRYPHTDWAGRLSARDRSVVTWAIQAVGAQSLAARTVDELSDGERQKVLIARALAQEPQIILLDEPTAFLDLPRRVEIMGVLRDLARSTGTAILLSTHDLDLALRSADRTWLMAGDGSLRTGAPEDLVLNGAFAQTFRSEGVEFDPLSGSFHINRRAAGVVGLIGEGLPAVWTTRALEREGFCVEQGIVEQGVLEGSIQIQVDETPTSLRWQVQIEKQQYTCHSVLETLQLVRRMTGRGILHEGNESQMDADERG